MLLCLFPMHRCRRPGLVWSLHQTCGALSLGGILPIFYFFVRTKQSFVGLIAQIFIIISKSLSLTRLVDFMTLPKYSYFTTWSIWHPLKYTLNGLVSPNPIHLFLILFTPIWFSLANLIIPSICFCSHKENYKEVIRPEEIDQDVLINTYTNLTFYNYPDHIGISLITIQSVHHPGLRPFCFRRMNWFSLCVWHVCLSYYTSCVMYL